MPFFGGVPAFAGALVGVGVAGVPTGAVLIVTGGGAVAVPVLVLQPVSASAAAATAVAATMRYCTLIPQRV